MQPTDSRQIFVDPSKVRKADQLAEYERILKDNICPFCLDHREEYTQGTRLYDGDHWWLFQNNWPYKNTRRHIMAGSREHNVYLEDLDQLAGNELFVVLQKLELEDGYSLAALEARFGFVMWTGASVAHFHMHLLIPEVTEVGDSLVVEYSFGRKLFDGEHWSVYLNARPHEYAREHFLIASTASAKFLNDLEVDAGSELFAHMSRLESEYDFTHGGFHSRLGNRLQAGDGKDRIVVELVAPQDDLHESDTKKLRFVVSENPEVDFKIST